MVPILLIVALLASLNYYVGHVRSERDKLQNALTQTAASLVTTTSIVKDQQVILGHMLELRQLDAETLSALHAENEQINKRAEQRTTVIAKLENDHVEVKTYLGTPVPDDLRGLLNSQLAKYRGADKADQSVPTRRALEKATTTASR